MSLLSDCLADTEWCLEARPEEAALQATETLTSKGVGIRNDRQLNVPCIILWRGWDLMFPALFRLQAWPKGSVMLSGKTICYMFFFTWYLTYFKCIGFCQWETHQQSNHKIMNIWNIIIRSKQSCLAICWQKSIIFQVKNCLGKTGRE